jgi:hypothetical protein
MISPSFDLLCFILLCCSLFYFAVLLHLPTLQDLFLFCCTFILFLLYQVLPKKKIMIFFFFKKILLRIILGSLKQLKKIIFFLKKKIILSRFSAKTALKQLKFRVSCSRPHFFVKESVMRFLVYKM